MRLPYLHKGLVWAVSALIVGSGLAISVVTSARYRQRLHDSAVMQAEYLANTIALAVNDKFASKDLKALEGLLSECVVIHPLVAYAFITCQGQVTAHTFPEGLPAWIQNANFLKHSQSSNYVRLQSERGESYLDIAWPVFKDHAGTLRIGVYEKPFVPTIHQLWLQSGLASVLVLILALTLAFILIKNMTRPLRNLAREADKVNENNLAFDFPPCKHEEISHLSSSFLKMVEGVKACSQKLEDRTVQLDRAHRQLFSTFDIIRVVGVHSTLYDVCSYLVGKLKEIAACSHLAMLMASRDRNFYFLFNDGRLDVIPSEQFETVWGLLAEINGLTFFKRSSISIPMLDGSFQISARIGVLPFHFENQKLGALFIGCPKDCQCQSQELEVIYLILQECSGAVKRAINHAEEMQSIDCQIRQQSQFCGIVGKDRQMQILFNLINDIAPTDAAVLIQGESGTGKELVARAIHEQGLRKDMPFVVINCSAYPTSLLESELFGHEKGAFTGAIRQKVGRFEQADGGTVFLDEIGEIALSAQIKLLRVLQTHTFERIGGEQTLHVHVRIIAATNKDLVEEVRKGRFREDLYYRLNVIPLNLPSLRKRPNDIPLLARHFLDRFNSQQGKTVKDFRTETMHRLLEYEWPGNVRELENTIEHALVLTKGDYIEVAALPTNMRPTESRNPAFSRNTVIGNEKKLFQEALEESGWNKKLAAKRLGVSRSTLYNKIKKYNLIQPTIH